MTQRTMIQLRSGKLIYVLVPDLLERLDALITKLDLKIKKPGFADGVTFALHQVYELKEELEDME